MISQCRALTGTLQNTGRPAHNKWLKDKKLLGHYHISEHEQIELKKKDETSPEMLEALGEAAAKVKAELKAKRKMEKEERRKKKCATQHQSIEACLLYLSPATDVCCCATGRKTRRRKKT